MYCKTLEISVIRQRGKSFDFDQSLILTITALLLDMNSAKQASSRTGTPDQPPLSLLPTLDFSHRQRAYKSTLAEDTALLEDLTVQGRQRMAVEVRLEEKELLAMAALRVDETIAATRCISRADAESSQM